MKLTIKEKREKIAEMEKRLDSPYYDLISQYSEEEFGEFISEEEVRKLAQINHAIEYLTHIIGDGGSHEYYTGVLVDYIKELEARLDKGE